MPITRDEKRNESGRFYSLADVTKHFKMPDVEVGMQVNARHAQPLAETLKEVVTSAMRRNNGKKAVQQRSPRTKKGG
ncbi:hypothetical protein [Pseudoxanthomonas sp.]|uniref:hypothetical protein n=1 Tax=Pseudoxanthomonas sp. TaxID=1871049 RepID=UPI003F81D8E4